MSLRKLKWRGIGRLELLAWLNEFLQTDYTKIEHLADGIAYCQIFDALYPGKINLQRLNFQARTETEYEHNFKVLRRTFHRCDIRKEIPARKLVQGIFQEHFEFLHWIHDYVHRTYPDAVRSYHGFERRQEALRLSDSDVKVNNTNLIPKYSSSLRMRQEGFNDKYAFELDEVRATKGPSIDEISSNVVLEDQKMDPVPYDDEEFGPMDPSVQLVRHSFSSTLRAKVAITNLEECFDNIDTKKPYQSKTASKEDSTRRPSSRSEVSSCGRKTKTRNVLAFKDPREPDPMMCRYISDLIDCLESELFGRMKDLQYLEKNVETQL